jgi:DnaK suppressor protein
MANLDERQTTDFGARLRQRADQLRAEIRTTLERSSDESHVRIAELARDEGDDSFSDLIVDLNLFDIDRDAQELRRIDGALIRLKEGTFGKCVDCGQNIALARLNAEPTATRCVNCQTAYEKTHASPGTPTM